MQQQQQPQLTPAQIQQQIQMQQQNILWNQKQQEIANTWNRQNTTQQQRIAHAQFMVEHIATPILIVAVFVIVALLLAYVVRTKNAGRLKANQDDNANELELKKAELAADIEKNKQDNASEVRWATFLRDKLEEKALQDKAS